MVVGPALRRMAALPLEALTGAGSRIYGGSAEREAGRQTVIDIDLSEEATRPRRGRDSLVRQLAGRSCGNCEMRATAATTSVERARAARARRADQRALYSHA